MQEVQRLFVQANDVPDGIARARWLPLILKSQIGHTHVSQIFTRSPYSFNSEWKILLIHSFYISAHREDT